MFKNTNLHYHPNNDIPKQAIPMPRVTGIYFTASNIDISEISFNIRGTLKIRNQFSFEININYSTQTEYFEVEDEEGYITHQDEINPSCVKLNCTLLGEDNSFLTIRSVFPVLLESLKTSNFIEQLLFTCNSYLALEAQKKGHSDILKLFFSQPNLTVFVFSDRLMYQFDICTLPTFCLTKKNLY